MSYLHTINQDGQVPEFRTSISSLLSNRHSKG